ncbi:MAG: aldo/keto reductase [Methanosphaera sp.]|nr:aldo/keto reductase [Methanosphaera sp.]
MNNLGFSFKQIHLNNSNDPSSIDYNQLTAMVDYYMDAGYNFFDVDSSNNGLYESTLYESVIKRYDRDQVVISDKLPTIIFDDNYDLESIFNNQLKRCGVDYYDYYLIDIDQYSEKIFTKKDSYDFLENLKKDNKVLNTGIKFSGMPHLLDNILSSYCDYIDIIELPLNYLDWYDTKGISSQRYYDVASKYDLDIIAFDPYKDLSTILLPDVEQKAYNTSHKELALRYLMQLDGVCGIINDFTSLVDLKTILNIDFKPLTDKEHEEIESIISLVNQEKVINCIDCGICVNTCPMDIPISKYFYLYNAYKLSDDLDSTRAYYNSYANNLKYRRASDCINCRQCIKKCPEKIDILSLLKDLADIFDLI